jgi:hypothetical protein
MLRQNAIITQVLAQASAITATTEYEGVYNNFDFDSVVFELNVTQVAATTTTLDVYVQTKDSAGNDRDVCRFAAFTASSANRHYAIVPVAGGAGAVKGAVGDRSISASTLGVPILTRDFKVAAVLTGTDAVSFTLTAYFNHQSGRA